MIVKNLKVGPIQTNCYIIGDETTKEGAIIDPGDEAGKIVKAVEELGLKIKFICLTHGHYDHTMGLQGVVQRLDVPVYIHPAEVRSSKTGGAGDLQMAPSDRLRHYGEGDTLTLGDQEIQVLHTPGHSLGSVTLKTGNLLFTGDTLFRDSCGRTDLYGGNYQSILSSLKRLYHLEGDFEVYPGHEAASTLDNERKRNYYMNEAVGKG